MSISRFNIKIESILVKIHIQYQNMKCVISKLVFNIQNWYWVRQELRFKINIFKLPSNIQYQNQKWRFELAIFKTKIKIEKPPISKSNSIILSILLSKSTNIKKSRPALVLTCHGTSYTYGALDLLIHYYTQGAM